MTLSLTVYNEVFYFIIKILLSGPINNLTFFMYRIFLNSHLYRIFKLWLKKQNFDYFL